MSRRLLLISQIYRPDPAAAGQYLADVAEEMAVRGWDVSVLTAVRGYDDPSVRYASGETLAGVHVTRLPLSSFGKRSIAARIVGGLSFVVQSIARALLMRGIDGILVSTSPPMVPLSALVLNALRGIPIVYWVMDVNPDLFVALGHARPDSLSVRLLDAVNRSVLRRARGIVVLDDFMARRIEAKGAIAHKLRIIPPWSRDTYLEPVAHAENPFRARHAFGDRFVVMYSGNHGPSAPLDTLIAAVRMLADDHRFMFVFAGGGIDKHEVDELASSQENVLSLPYQDLSELRYSLSAADVHVVSTGDEMAGIVHQSKVYGAIAVARPVLFLGPSESPVGKLVSEHAFGWRVAHGDVRGVVAILRQLYSERDGDVRAKGDLARRASEDFFSTQRLRDDLCTFVEESLQPERGVQG